MALLCSEQSPSSGTGVIPGCFTPMVVTDLARKTIQLRKVSIFFQVNKEISYCEM